MRLVVFGANGGTGRAVVEQALGAGHLVTAVTRHPETFGMREERLEVVRGDATDSSSVAELVRGQDAVLSALGQPYTFAQVRLYSVSARQIIEGMVRSGVSRLVVVSSAAVDTGEGTQGSPIYDLVVEPLLTRVVGRTSYDDMRRMETTIRESDLTWTIVRPPALFDAPAVGRHEVSTSFVRGLHASRQDVAAVMLDAATSDRFAGEVAHVVSRDGSPSVLRTIWNDAVKPNLQRLVRR